MLMTNSHVLTDEEIVRSPEQSSNSSTEDEDVDEPHPVFLLKDAQEAIVTLRRFFEQQEEGSNYFDQWTGLLKYIQ